jgi:hypothetical protein
VKLLLAGARIIGSMRATHSATKSVGSAWQCTATSVRSLRIVTEQSVYVRADREGIIDVLGRVPEPGQTPGQL